MLGAEICDERVDGAAGLVETERKAEWRKLRNDVGACFDKITLQLHAYQSIVLGMLVLILENRGTCRSFHDVKE